MDRINLFKGFPAGEKLVKNVQMEVMDHQISAVTDLQILYNSQNEIGNTSKHTTEHSTTVVDNLKTRLMSTTKEFKEVLTMRTEVTKNSFVFTIHLEQLISP